MEECLAYFRQAIERPGTVPTWGIWWGENEATVRQVFAHMDYVRLKHRKLVGAVAILERRGWSPPQGLRNPLRTGFCPDCGEPVVWQSAGPGGGSVFCPNHCFECVYDCRVEAGSGSRDDIACSPEVTE